MTAAISLLVILSVSVLIIRTAGVALRLTGLPQEVARFQARSAFTGAGFTTLESESVVNYPLRRRVIGYLMIIGNLGFVSVMAAVVVSFVSMEKTTAAFVQQLLWFLGMLLVLWFIALNPLADRLMCRIIGWALHRWTSLGKRVDTNLLQVAHGYSVREHRVREGDVLAGKSLGELSRTRERMTVLGVRRSDGRYFDGAKSNTRLRPDDALILYGRDARQDEFESRRARGD